MSTLGNLAEMELSDTKQIRIYWCDLPNGPTEVWRARNVSMEHPEHLSAKIWHEDDPQDSYRLLIFKDKDQWKYRCDVYDDSPGPHPLKCFSGEDELVFFASDAEEILHIHCSLK